MDVLDKYMQGLQDQVQNVSQQVANLTQSQQRLEANVLQQVRYLVEASRCLYQQTLMIPPKT